MMWPTPHSGYSGKHLLKIWGKVRKECAENEKPLKLIGHSVDSAGFSLSASITLMTPIAESVSAGMYYLALGIPDERFIAPYFWSLPSIAYGDHDHLRRTFLRILKYQTRELTFFKCKKGSTIATINHLCQLREVCSKIEENVPFSANDLILISFFDQRPDTANRIFTLRVAEMLERNVTGSEGTCLYIKAVYHLTQPFHDFGFGSPEEIQKSVSTGMTIFRLWRKYLELKNIRLHAQAGAAKQKEKRGHFLTYGAYTTAELLFSAATLHCLAMFLHFKNAGPELCSPHRSGTISTEKIIGQLQGKTNQLQSLNVSPTFGDMLSKSKDLQFTTDALTELEMFEGITIPSTSNRKLSHFRKQKAKDMNYQYPKEYEEFVSRQRKMHCEGVKAAQEIVKKHLPKEFEDILQKNGSWDLPYQHTKPKDIKVKTSQTLPTGYNFLDFSLADQSKTKHTEDIMEIEDNLVEDEEDELFLRVKSEKNEKINSVSPNKSSATNDKEKEERNKESGQGEQEEETEDEEEETKTTSLTKNSKWYILRNGEKIHINRALKLILPREYISKERSKRHWVSKHLPLMNPIASDHNVIRFRDVAIIVGKTFDLLHIVSIQSEDGKELTSTKTTARGHTIRGQLYKRIDTNTYCCPDTVMVTGWIPVWKVIGELSLEKNENGSLSLSDESRKNLENHFPVSKSQFSQSCTQVHASNREEYYEVEKILEVRINKTFHTEEYKVRFKGYDSSDDLWLPSSAFRQPVSFETISKRGRIRKHKMKDEHEEEADHQPAKKMKTPISRKRKKPIKQKRKAPKKCDGSKFRKNLPEITQVTSCDSSDELSDLENSVQPWVTSKNPTLVCSGSFHQGLHPSFHYPGQQCCAISLTALVYSTIKTVDSWTKDDLDSVLLLGDKLHFNQLCLLRKDPRGDQKLALDELPSKFIMRDYKFHCNLSEIVAGTIFQRDSCDDFSAIEDAFEKCEEQNALGIVLRVLEYCVSCIYCCSVWYLVDSHARNKDGMPDERGAAIVLNFKSSTELIHLIRIFMETATASKDLNINDLTFEALIVTTKRELNSKEDGQKHSDVAVLPHTKLFSAVYAHGATEVFSNSIGRLEEGKEMDDNIVDFFLLYTINTILQQDQQEHIYLFNSCFYAKLILKFNPVATRKWTRSVDIFSKDLIIIPVCTNSHWRLVMVKVEIPRMLVMILDSNKPELASPCYDTERKIKRYLEDEWMSKHSKKALKVQLDFHVTYPSVPQQTNLQDCGVYAMKTLQQFIKSYPINSWNNWRPVYDQDDVMQLRREIQFLLQHLAFTKGTN